MPSLHSYVLEQICVVLGAVAMVEPWHCGKGGILFQGLLVLADFWRAAGRLYVGSHCNVAFKVLVLGYYFYVCWSSVLVASRCFKLATTASAELHGSRELTD